MLETVREHALDTLRAESALDELRDRHAEHFLDLALEPRAQLAGPDQARWLDRLERDLDNLTSCARMAPRLGCGRGCPPRDRCARAVLARARAV